MFDLPYQHYECAAVFYEEAAYVQNAAGFDEAFEHILDVEGEEFNPDDPSRYGVTGPELARYLNYKEVVTPERIRLMTKAEARGVYLKLYWQGLRINQIRSQKIATAVLDQSVHRGAFGGIVFLQKFINSFAQVPVVTVNGILTAQTLDVLNQMDEQEFMEAFVKAMRVSYRSIVKSNPKKRQYLNGWIARSNAILALISR